MGPSERWKIHREHGSGNLWYIAGSLLPLFRLAGSVMDSDVWTMRRRRWEAKAWALIYRAFQLIWIPLRLWSWVSQFWCFAELSLFFFAVARPPNPKQKRGGRIFGKSFVIKKHTTAARLLERDERKVICYDNDELWIEEAILSLSRSPLKPENLLKINDLKLNGFVLRIRLDICFRFAGRRSSEVIYLLKGNTRRTWKLFPKKQ